MKMIGAKMESVAKEVLGAAKTLREEWISENTWDLIEEHKGLHLKWQPSSSDNAVDF